MAKEEIPETLSPALIDHLQEENLVLLATIEKDEAAPNVTAISWVKPVDEKTIRFSITNQSRMLTNLITNPKLILTIFTDATVYSIKGTATVLEETMADVPLKLAKVEVEVRQVFDSMFWGAELTGMPTFQKTYNPEKAKKLDEEVYAALLK